MSCDTLVRILKPGPPLDDRPRMRSWSPLSGRRGLSCVETVGDVPQVAPVVPDQPKKGCNETQSQMKPGPPFGGRRVRSWSPPIRCHGPSYKEIYWGSKCTPPAPIADEYSASLSQGLTTDGIDANADHVFPDQRST